MVLEGTLLVGGLELGLGGRLGNLMEGPVSGLDEVQDGGRGRAYPEAVVELGILDHCEESLEG